MVNFFVKFLSEPTVVLGLVAMIGLIAMKNRPSTVIQGTMKTMLGFLILSAGVEYGYRRTIISVQSLILAQSDRGIGKNIRSSDSFKF